MTLVAIGLVLLPTTLGLLTGSSSEQRVLAFTTLAFSAFVMRATRELSHALQSLLRLRRELEIEHRIASNAARTDELTGLNNLRDITLEARWSALCGYTDADIDTVFAPELPGLDRDEIRRWYNGYNWLGTSVYNPFDVLLLLRNREFRPYWFETGTPTFLVTLLAQRGYFTPDLAQLMAPEALLSTFDVDHIPPEALLFQAGYLTIGEVCRIPGLTQIQLRYPNLEVRTSLNAVLLQAMTANPALRVCCTSNCNATTCPLSAALHCMPSYPTTPPPRH